MTTTRIKGLTRGARATIYRDGTELHSAVDIPAAGAFALRSLPPGQWVARDSCGGEQAFTVEVGQEYAVLLDGDTIGVTGEPGVSGSAEVPAHLVGPGGGIFSRPGQVAAEDGVSGRIGRVDGEMPAEGELTVPRAERPSQRPKDPEAETRVPGSAGAALVQDSPVRSVDETVAEAERRNKLGEGDPEARALEELEVEDAAVPVAREVKPDPVGPAPLEPTLPPEGYGASSSATPTPLVGRVEGDEQPPLGALPEAA